MKAKQIRIDADMAFFEELRKQKLRRGLTTQEFVARAIRLYSSIPEERLAALFASEEKSFTIPLAVVWKTLDPRRRQSPRDRVAPSPEVLEQIQRVFHEVAAKAQRQADGELLLDLLKQFPPEKIRSIIETMVLDLKYYKSARIVPERKSDEQKSE